MRRPIVGLLVAGVALAGGCARPGDASGGVVLPTSTTLVAQLSEEGGFVMPGSLRIRAPRLAVYSDGTAVADADRSLTLTANEVTTLVADLRDGLAGLPATVESTDDPQVADAPSTMLKVLRADGTTQSVSAYALGLQSGYPSRLVRLAERMQALAERTSREGTDYVADRVRVVAMVREDRPDAPAWPAAVPVPRDDAGSNGVGVLAVESTAAGPVTQAWPLSVNRGSQWPVARLPDGTVVGVAWRYLLPHE